jgi:hypothetical protein
MLSPVSGETLLGPIDGARSWDEFLQDPHNATSHLCEHLNPTNAH